MQPLDLTTLTRALEDNYVLVLTTNSNERKALTKFLTKSAKVDLKIDNDGARLGLCGEELILHITGTSGGQADKAVGRITRKVLSDHRLPKPKAVILLGIAWGAPKRFSIGDVILSGEILAVNQLRLEEGGARHVALPRKSSWSEELAALGFELGKTMKEPKVGVLLSGEQFVAADGARDKLLDAYPHALGGEMEGWDLVPDLMGLPWLQIRGVSDFASTGLVGFRSIIAAEAAAEYLPQVITKLREGERLAQQRRDPATQSLIEVLSGNSIRILAPEEGIGLDDHLNYRVGPSLIWRISNYGLGAPSSASLPRTLAALVLELAQNAFRHGNASQVTINFDEASISYSDDAARFDIFSLIENVDGRGGRRALKDVIEGLIDQNYLTISADEDRNKKGNKYKMSFPMLSSEIRNARSMCAVDVVGDGSVQLKSSVAVASGYRCTTMFFDASEVVMVSRHFDVAEKLQVVLDEGSDLIIKCDNKQEKALYEDALSVPGGRRLTVVVGPVGLFASS